MGQALVIKNADFSSVKVEKITIVEPSGSSGEIQEVTLSYTTRYSGKSLSTQGTIQDSSVSTYVVDLYDISSVQGTLVGAKVTCRNGTGIGNPSCVFLNSSMQPIQLEFIGTGEATVHTDERLNVPAGAKYMYVTGNTKYITPGVKALVEINNV